MRTSTTSSDNLGTLYAQELHRVLTWRRALSTMQTLATGSVAATVLVTFGLAGGASHVFFAFTSLAVWVLLIVDACMYRLTRRAESRLWLIEQHALVPALDPTITPTEGNDAACVASLDRADFRIGFIEACARRIAQAYFLIFIALDICWIGHLSLLPESAQTWTAFINRAAVGFLPGWVVLTGGLAGLAACVILLVWMGCRRRQERMV